MMYFKRNASCILLFLSVISLSFLILQQAHKRQQFSLPISSSQSLRRARTPLQQEGVPSTPLSPWSSSVTTSLRHTVLATGRAWSLWPPGLRTSESASNSLSSSEYENTSRPKTTTTVTNPRQKVYVLPPASSDDSGKTSHSSSNSNSVTSEHKHFILDGIEASAKLELTDDPLDTEAIWIVNAGRYSCDLLRKEIDRRLHTPSSTLSMSPLAARTVARRIEQEDETSLSSSSSTTLSSRSQMRYNKNQERHIGYDNPWSIVIMDWTDKGVLMEDYKSCLEHIYYSFGYSNQHTFVATRTIIQGRHLQRDMASHNSSISSSASVIYGDPIDYAQELSIHSDNNGGNGSKLEKNDGKPAVPLFAGHVQPIRFGVRGDLVDTINRLMEHPSTDAEDIVTRKRTGDAVHFWPVGSGMKWYGQFRSAVSQTMREFALEEISHAAWNITTDEVGSRKKAGRNLVADAYAEALLSYKIVVVAQRDEWEGHYRLMEGLAGGALVMTDPMHPLPCGLVDGTHLIVYKSMAQLKSYLKYYLEHDDERVAIAKNGYEAAMKYHRSWNIMEQMVFGDWSKEYCTG